MIEAGDNGREHHTNWTNNGQEPESTVAVTSERVAEWQNNLMTCVHDRALIICVGPRCWLLSMSARHYVSLFV